MVIATKQQCRDYSEFPIENLQTIALIGYFIVCNQQIHSYQVQLVRNFLAEKCVPEAEQYMQAVFGGRDDAPSRQRAEQLFLDENVTTQKDVLRLVYALGSVDGVFDSQESNFYQGLCNLANIASDDVEIVLFGKAIADNFLQKTEVAQSSKIANTGWWARLVSRIILFIQSIVSMLLGRSGNPRQANFWADPQYMDAIQKCAVIAQTDFAFVKPKYVEFRNEGGILLSQLTSLQAQIGTKMELERNAADSANCFQRELQSRLDHTLVSAEQSLYQMEHLLPYFTISVMGRTKAGKSTLHSILSGESHENIGVGEQRTTRFNRVYQWNRLRIIDTPGVGSAEAEGRTDEQIAESISGESDLICIVIAADNIPPEVIQLMEKRAKRNQPVIVLLNYKYDLLNEHRFQRFLQHPDAWFEESGENSIWGHVKRIHEVLGGNATNIVKVYPVFLYAAVLAKKAEYKKYQKLLWNASHIDGFLCEIKSQIVVHGALRRSQTLIDDTVFLCTQYKNDLLDCLSPVQQLVETLIETEVRVEAQLSKAQEKLLKDCTGAWNAFCDKLCAVHARAFAEEYVDKRWSKRGRPEDEWSAYLEGEDVSRLLSDEIEELTIQYNNATDTIVKEVCEDIDFSMEKEDFSGWALEGSNDFSWKRPTSWGGRILSLAGTVVLPFVAPLGWVLTGIGLGLDLGSKRLKSKDEKRKESVTQLADSITKTVKDKRGAIIKDRIENIENKSGAVQAALITSIHQSRLQLEEIVKHVNPYCELLEHGIQDMNKAFAWRILQSVCGNTCIGTDEPGQIQPKIDRDIVSVLRRYGSEMIIKTRYPVHSISKLGGVIREEITILSIQEDSTNE